MAGDNSPLPADAAARYTGRVGLVAQSLLITDNAVFPDSFRWHLKPDPLNPAMINAGPGLCPHRSREAPHQEPWPAPTTYLDNAYYDHFGHLMTEVLSKLWGWDRAKEEFPDLKAIYRAHPDSRPGRGLGRRLFEA